ncbi:protein of unknown function DUF262 [Indivirus ILV1]|uniref:GmrSD restriction endonucleases N-terminal domain-containing protein n=1 Tax=Indivirus ILV1 TaxID=1977633 RepID=A0A1V0SDN5_9VIRU|nr:protein of unknown function DUF262 [Indivirus ILV1]
MDDDKFKSALENKSVSTIVTECNNGQIDLTARYQRDIVWKEDQKSAFIDSVFKNIVPNNIILNLSRNNNKFICIDGKQRLTSLCEYMKNKYCFEWKNEFIYYDNVPSIYADDKNYRHMTNSEKADFGFRSLPVVKYDDLSYEDQVDIFNRIQKGAKLTAGELIMSIFKTDKGCEAFRNFCDKQKDLVSKYVISNKERNGHVILISDLLYILESNNNNIPTKKQRDDFLGDYSTQPKIHKLIESFEPKLTIYFSKSLFNNQIFTKSIINNMNNSIFLSIFIYCKELYTIEELTDTQCIQLRNAIVKTIKKCSLNKQLSKKTADTVQSVQTILKNELKLTNKNKSTMIIDDDYEEDEEDQEEDKEILIVKPKPIKKLKSKQNKPNK